MRLGFVLLFFASVLPAESAGEPQYRAGSQLLREGRCEDAARAFVEALVADPAHPGARDGWKRARYETSLRMSRERTLRGDFEGARRYANAARELFPDAARRELLRLLLCLAAAGVAYVLSLVFTLFLGLRAVVSSGRRRTA